MMAVYLTELNELLLRTEQRVRELERTDPEAARDLRTLMEIARQRPQMRNLSAASSYGFTYHGIILQ